MKKVRKLRKNRRAIVTEGEIIMAISQFLMDCDVDQLAKLAGEVLGGKCEYKVEENYYFTPDEKYGGAFDGRK